MRLHKNIRVGFLIEPDLSQIKPRWSPIRSMSTTLDPKILGDAFKLVLAAIPKNHGEMLHLHEDICGDDIGKYELLLNVCCDHCPFRKLKRPEVVSALAMFLGHQSKTWRDVEAAEICNIYLWVRQAWLRTPVSKQRGHPALDRLKQRLSRLNPSTDALEPLAPSNPCDGWPAYPEQIIDSDADDENWPSYHDADAQVQSTPSDVHLAPRALKPHISIASTDEDAQVLSTPSDVHLAHAANLHVNYRPYGAKAALRKRLAAKKKSKRSTKKKSTKKKSTKEHPGSLKINHDDWVKTNADFLKSIHTSLHPRSDRHGAHSWAVSTSKEGLRLEVLMRSKAFYIRGDVYEHKGTTYKRVAWSLHRGVKKTYNAIRAQLKF